MLHIAFSVDTLAVYQLQGRTLLDSDVLGSPGALAVGTQYLLVSDDKASHPLLVLDRVSGAIVRHAGAVGSGPRELRGGERLDFKAGQDEGWLVSVLSQSLVYAHLDSLVATGMPSDRKIQSDWSQGVVLNATVWTDHDSVVGSGLLAVGGFAVFDASGAYHNSIGGDPPDQEDASISVRNQAWNATLRVSPDGRHFIAAFDNADRLDIYEGGTLKKVVRGPEFFDPIYLEDDAGGGAQVLALLPENRYGYADVTVTNERIFALFSGKERDATSRGTQWGSYILAFDWTGRPFGKLTAPGSPCVIAASSDNRDLYAIYLSPAPHIVHFPLPEALGSVTE